MKKLKKFEEFVNENINESVRMDREDCILSSDGNKYSVSCAGEFLGDFVEYETAMDVIKDWREENGYYPNIWFVSDHGNSWKIDDNGEEIKTSETEEETDFFEDGDFDPAGGRGLHSHE